MCARKNGSWLEPDAVRWCLHGRICSGYGSVQVVCLLPAIKKRYEHPKAIPINQPATPPKNQLYAIASMLRVLSAHVEKT